MVLLTSSAFCSSAVGIARSSVSSAVAIPGRDTITEAIEVAATSRRNSALEDDVCAHNCVVGIEEDDDDDDNGRTNASDDATRAVTRTTQQDFMI